MQKRRRIEITKFRHRRTVILCAGVRNVSTELSRPEVVTIAPEGDLPEGNDVHFSNRHIARRLLKKFFEVPDKGG